MSEVVWLVDPVSGEPINTRIAKHVPMLHACYALASSKVKGWLRDKIGAEVSAGIEGFGIKTLEVSRVAFYGKPGPDRVREVILTVHRYDLFPYDVAIRGDSVTAYIRLWHNGVPYVLLVEQERLPVGTVESVELVAGMLDDDDPLAAIIRECKEEAGFELTAEQFVRVTPDKGVALTPGTTDERMHAYVCDVEVDYATIERLGGATYGLAYEGERTTVMLVPESDFLSTVTEDSSGACIAYAHLMRHESEARYAEWLDGVDPPKYFLLTRDEAISAALAATESGVPARVVYQDGDTTRTVTTFL